MVRGGGVEGGLRHPPPPSASQLAASRSRLGAAKPLIENSSEVSGANRVRGSILLVVGADDPWGGFQQVDAAGDLFHAAVEAVADAAGEVDEAAGDLALGVLEVHD